MNPTGMEKSNYDRVHRLLLESMPKGLEPKPLSFVEGALCEVISDMQMQINDLKVQVYLLRRARRMRK